jgi:hypothetical protein
MATVTLIMPFDTGRSYATPTTDFDWDNVLTQRDRSDGWAPAYPPSYIRQPLGKPVILDIKPAREFQSAEVAAGWLSHDFELKAIFFPVGIGILFLRGRLVSQGTSRWSSLPTWETGAYARFAPVARSALKSFAELTTRVGLRALHQVDRKVDAPDFPWIYPLFFVDPTTAITDIPSVLETRSLDGSQIAIHWKGTDVLAPHDDRVEVEWYYIVASVVWQSLFIIDTLLSQLLVELENPALKQHQRAGDRINELQQVRLFCKKIVDASRTLRWTISRGGVELLDGIHAAWSTSEMWQSINDKISLLVLFHEQQEAEVRESVGGLIGYVGLLIATVSTVSAVSDLFTLVDPQGQVVPIGLVRLAMAFFPAVVFGALTYLGLRRLQRRLRS